MKRTLLALIGIAGIAGTINAQWSTVGGAPVTTVTGSYSNLVIDNAGNYYASYYGGGVSQGSVQKYNGTSWSFLGSQGVSPGFATYNGVAVNASGEVFYCYQDGSNSSRMSVRKYSPSTSAWSDIGTAISGNTVNYQNIRIIPSTGMPVVSYNQASTGLVVKRYDGSSWITVGNAEPVLTGTGANHSLAIGNNDSIYLAVQVGTAYSVYRAHINAAAGTAWTLVGNIGFADGGSSNQFTVSLAIDASSHLYIAYRALSADGSKIAIRKFDGSSWVPAGNQLFSTGNVEHISIAVTPAGIPVVAYRDNTASGQTYVYRLAGTTWESLGAASANIGNWNSVALTSSGVPVVAFCEGTGVNAGVITVKQYNTSVITAVDSVVVSTLNNVAPGITTNAGTLQMEAAVFPAAVSQNVSWSIVPVTGSAAINTSGLVTAQTNGTVWAKAVSVADASKMDSMLITISGQIVPVTGIQVTTQNNVPAAITTNGGTLQTIATILPATANQDVTWSIVPGTGNATINISGLVTAVANGTVWAKAVSVQNTSMMDSLEITISGQLVPVTGIQVTTQNNVPPAITTNGGTLQTIATILPATANQGVTWSIVSGTGNATINTSGLVTALTNGTVWAKAVSAQDAAQKDSISITISNQTAAGIAENDRMQELQVYPNPAGSSVSISLNRAHPATGLYLKDIRGRVLAYRRIAANELRSPYTLSLQDLSPGVYFLELNGESIYAVEKLLIR